MVLVDYRILRNKHNERKIPVEATFERVWEQMELLLSESTLKMFIERNISNKFYGFDLKYILDQREKNGSIIGKPIRFINASESEFAAKKAILSLKQAQEYFQSANNVSFMTKPLFLYYGMVSFAKSLIESTYKVNYVDKNNKQKHLNHGLNVYDNQDNFNVIVQREGEYQTFRDCYIGDPHIYSEKGLKVSIKDLLAVIPGMRIEWKLAFEKSFNSVYEDLTQEIPEHDKYFKSFTHNPLRTTLKTSIDEYNVLYELGDSGEINIPKSAKKGKNGTYIVDHQKFVHIIDAYYLAMFILCFYARYRPYKWNQFLNEESNLFLIKTFLRRAELDFPMLIYSELTGIKTYFETIG